MEWMRHTAGEVYRPAPAQIGLGTLIATALRRLGIERLVHQLMPQGCACKARQDWLDRHFPLRWLAKVK